MEGKNGAFLQKLGEAMRVLDEDYWVKKLALKLAEAKPEVAIVPDVRYPNELRWIRSHDKSLLVKVQRLHEDGTPWIATDRPADHISETALDAVEDHSWDYITRAMNGDMRRLSMLGTELADRALRMLNEA